MKKHFIVCSIILIGLLLTPSLGVASFQADHSTPDALSGLRQQRLKDIHSNIPLVVPAGLYHTYAEMTDLLQALVTNHSDIMSLVSLGRSYEGRELWMVKLSDNVSLDEDEPGVLFMGAHHGNEKPSYEVLIYFVQYMVEQYHNCSNPEIKEVIDATQIYVVPMVNPDGVEAGTRKNTEPNYGSFGFKPKETSIGVDLNRNYGYRWFFLYLRPFYYLRSTSFQDSSSVYRGERPFSEKETQAIRQFVSTHNIILCLTYHTYGELILYPWGYTSTPPEDLSIFVSIGENISSINQYTSGSSVNLYPTIGDASDWLYGTLGIYPFTIEMGKSSAPTNPEIIKELCVVHTAVNLYICKRAQTF